MITWRSLKVKEQEFRLTWKNRWSLERRKWRRVCGSRCFPGRAEGPSGRIPTEGAGCSEDEGSAELMMTNSSVRRKAGSCQSGCGGRSCPSGSSGSAASGQHWLSCAVLLAMPGLGLDKAHCADWSPWMERVLDKHKSVAGRRCRSMALKRLNVRTG